MRYKATFHIAVQAYLGGIEAQALDGLQKGLDGVIAGGKHISISDRVLLLTLVALPYRLPPLLQDAHAV